MTFSTFSIKAKDIYRKVKYSKTPIGNNAGVLYRLRGPHFWEVLDDTQITEQLRELYPEFEQGDISASQIKAAIKILKEDVYIKVVFVEDSQARRYCRLNNGIFDMQEQKLIQFESWDGPAFRTRLDFSYIPEAQWNSPVFDRFLKMSLMRKLPEIRRCYTIILQMLTRFSEKRSVGFLTGASNSGKSVLAEFIRNLYYPPSTVTSVSLENMGDNFYLGQLGHARVNICNEVSDKGISRKAIQNFKIVADGGKLEANQKYKDPYTASFGQLVMMFCSNSVPVLGEADTDPFINRIIGLYFPVSISMKDQDPGLPIKIWYERDTICSRALAMLREVYGGIPDTESDEIINRQIQETSGLLGINEFLYDWCEPCEGFRTPTKDISVAFNLYCDTNALPKIGNISRRITQLGIQKIRHRIPQKNVNVHCFMGIRLKQEVLELIHDEGYADELLGWYPSIMNIESNVPHKRDINGNPNDTKEMLQQVIDLLAGKTRDDANSLLASIESAVKEKTAKKGLINLETGKPTNGSDLSDDPKEKKVVTEPENDTKTDKPMDRAELLDVPKESAVKEKPAKMALKNLETGRPTNGSDLPDDLKEKKVATKSENDTRTDTPLVGPELLDVPKESAVKEKPAKMALKNLETGRPTNGSDLPDDLKEKKVVTEPENDTRTDTPLVGPEPSDDPKGKKGGNQAGSCGGGVTRIDFRIRSPKRDKANHQ